MVEGGGASCLPEDAVVGGALEGAIPLRTQAQLQLDDGAEEPLRRRHVTVRDDEAVRLHAAAWPRPPLEDGHAQVARQQLL